jgi:alpha-tubulin suppressor-like RCC1 family protein
MQDMKYSVFSPRHILALRHVVVRSIACGYYHCLCLSVLGQVFSWGRAANGRLGRAVHSLRGCRPPSAGPMCHFEDDLSYGEPDRVIFPWGHGAHCAGNTYICNY